ncbi:sugar phosphate isomerase/epimerase family protein [Kumtagia ephedrae]|uniref:Sugar phosphate isomerase/epimerase n=1 Tax=Kumtagia ephedrae TaxID=2116701 RepID=A0A2P7SJV6_9HYPH|nr:sugar phosphate isomerase/epimerase [Mesorhizobium ephedrae]PSJ62635.1 sugar phosphate isomerase/epimerase [Mesorhizobium ephedrae]
MKISLCTISFRHHLVSLEDIAMWAAANDFQGIELWGVHARNLVHQPHRNADWLAGLGLSVPMLSDYLPLEGDAEALRRKTVDLCRLACNWRAGKLRTFAGSRGSRDTPADVRRLIAARLREISAIAADFGLSMLAETHPDTLADTCASTLDLVAEVDHPAFRLNFDTLHVWEGGDDPVAAHAALRPYVSHYHLKNVRSRADLAVFAPANVYAAAGSRDGLTPLFEGEVDYAPFFDELVGDPQVEASLEWFGNDCFNVLRKDRLAIKRLTGRHDALPRPAAFPYVQNQSVARRI